MEDADFLEKHDGHTTALALADISAKPREQGFNVLP